MAKCPECHKEEHNFVPQGVEKDGVKYQFNCVNCGKGWNESREYWLRRNK